MTWDKKTRQYTNATVEANPEQYQAFCAACDELSPSGALAKFQLTEEIEILILWALKYKHELPLKLFNRGRFVFTEKIINRFWSKVDKSTNPNGCWIWKGGTSKKGYGIFGLSGYCLVSAHRFSYQLVNGKPPDDKPWVLHSCDTPSCVKPEHLFPGTPTDNVLDMRAKGRQVDTIHLMKKRAKGEDNGSAKLNWDKVLEIRRRHATGVEFMSHLAREFGVACSTVQNIIANKKWRVASGI